MVEGGMKCVKYLLFVFNLIFFLCGIALVAVGAFVANMFRSAQSAELTAGAYFIIAIGVIIFVVTFFGVFGAIKENHCMLITFSVLLGLIFVLQVAASIVAFVERNKVTQFASKEAILLMKDYGNTTAVTEFVDYVQLKFKCCGASNASDWLAAFDNGAKLPAKGDVPNSCCKQNTTNCGSGQARSPSNNIYEQGCVSAVEPFLRMNLGAVGGIAIGIAFVEILGIVLACCLAAAVKEEYQVA